MPNLFQPTALVGAIAIAMGFSATASAQDSVNASLDTLVVTATRSEEKVKDVPARITVISKSEIEKKGIKIALNRAEDADLKLVIVSAKNVDFTVILKSLLSKDAILVVNKSDLIKGKLNSKFKKYEHVLISIKKDLNLNKLISKIKNKLKNKFISSENILITRERHRQNLKNCVYHLQKFQEKKLDNDFDKAAEDLRLATRHLGMIVGKVDVEELLGSIFNDFCIGK